MPTRQGTLSSSKKTRSSKSTSRKAASSKTARLSGPLPPYGVAIREAIARGNYGEMRKLAASTRKYLSDVQSALNELEKSTGKKRS
jgi:hypothetical protein